MKHRNIYVLSNFCTCPCKQCCCSSLTNCIGCDLVANKSFDKVSDVIIDIFKEADISKVDKTGKQNIDYILKGFDKDFTGITV